VIVESDDALGVLDKIIQAGEGNGLRPFVGRRAIERELREGTSRWATVGLLVDWQEYAKLFTDRGLLVPKDENPLPWELMLYATPERESSVGYATSFMYSPMLQRHIAIARVKPELAAVGSTVHVEMTADHEYLSVPAVTARLPLYNPPRKTSSSPRELATITTRMEQR
jgi:aminomethyltransferase